MKEKKTLGVIVVLLLAMAFLWPSDAEAGGVRVHTWEELKAALNGDHNHEGIVLTKDIKAEDAADLDSGIRPPNSTVDTALAVSGPCTLNLGGHTLTLVLSPETAPDAAGIAVLPNGTLTLENGSLQVDADFALVNTGTLILQDLAVEGNKAALLDVGNSYTEIRSGSYIGREEAGYFNYGASVRIDDGSFEGPMYGYFGGPLSKKVAIKKGQFHSQSYALHNEDSDSLVDYLALGATVTQDGMPFDLNASPYSIQGNATINTFIPSVAKNINFFIGDSDFYVTEEQLVHAIPMDVAPFINAETNRSMLPVRFVGEALGMEVAYDPDTRNVSLIDGQNTIILTLDNREFFRNGGAFLLETPPAVVNGRTMLPIGEMADMIGLSRTDPDHPRGYIEWDGTLQRIFISRREC